MKCWCGIEFEPNNRQLYQLSIGNKAHCCDICKRNWDLFTRDTRPGRARGQRTEKEIERARQYAALNCTRYDQCCDTAARTNKPRLNCHKCDSPEWLKNAWQMTQPLESAGNFSSFDEHSVGKVMYE